MTPFEISMLPKVRLYSDEFESVVLVDGQRVPGLIGFTIEKQAHDVAVITLRLKVQSISGDESLESEA